MLEQQPDGWYAVVVDRVVVAFFPGGSDDPDIALRQRQAAERYAEYVQILQSEEVSSDEDDDEE